MSRNPRLGVVRDDGVRPRRRHISWSSDKFGVMPICAERDITYRWHATTSETIHKALPLCKKCVGLVQRTAAALAIEGSET
jgi:hypothetical protein